MNRSSIVWRCIITLFSFYIQNLLPAGCRSFIPLGYLTVQPAPLFQMGSNLTVYCHITKFQHTQKWLDISLDLNGKKVDSWRRINGTTMLFSLPNVSTPESTVLCKLKINQQSRIVVGQKLHGGLPPDKPLNITCETTRRSNVTDCSWKRGRETFLPTFYNISLTRENGTQIQFGQVKAAEKVTISRATLEENTTYELVITAYNHFGVSQSDPFTLCITDTVLPDTPHITNVEFKNNSITAILQWKTSESSADLRAYLRLRTHSVSWAIKEKTELRGGLIRVDDLRPLTEYEFQIQTCESRSKASSFTTVPNISRTLCSKWSQSVWRTSPGKGPSKQLDVWRTFSRRGKEGIQAVTVLWKPPPPEDYSGEVHHYQIFWVADQNYEVNCAAAVTQWLVQVPAGVQTLSVSAVTSYGTSPPAEVALRHTGIVGPVLEELCPAANGSALLISWERMEDKQGSTQDGGLLYYVLEWTSIPGAGLQWEKLGKDLTNMSITGLTAGLRYSVSLHAVTSRGVSAPSSRLIYSSEKTPVSGPNMLVLIHEAKRIQIQWDELPVDQRRGFITKYTIYIQTLDFSSPGFHESVSAAGERQMWLDCPEGALTLKMTASTSAGEGPSGRQVSSLPPDPAVNLVVVIVLIISVFFGIVANMMCCTCVRKRVKQQCISWGPAWLVENLPKPERSNAIRLLEHEGSEALFSSFHSDPPLSPVTVISQEEKDEVYPTIHVEQPALGQLDRMETKNSLKSDTWTVLGEECGYKPQLAALPHQEVTKEEEDEKQIQVPTNKADEGCPGLPDGLIMTSFLFDVDTDSSDSHQELIHSSVNDLLLPRNVEKTELNRDVMQTRSEIKEDGRLDGPSLGLTHDDIGTRDMTDACWSRCSGDETLNGGYFPQRAPVRGDTP